MRSADADLFKSTQARGAPDAPRDRSNTARRTDRAAIVTTPAPLDATPERPTARRRHGASLTTHATPQPRQKASESPTCPATAGGRAYLVERGLEQDGYEALKALVSDYLDQAAVLDDVPMAVSPLASIRTRTWRAAGNDPQGAPARGGPPTTSETRSGSSRSRTRYMPKPRRSPTTPDPTSSSRRTRLIATPYAIDSSPRWHPRW